MTSPIQPLPTQRISQMVVNGGLYLDRTPLQVPESGLLIAENVRLDRGRISNRLIGYLEIEQFEDPVVRIGGFRTSVGVQFSIVCTAGGDISVFDTTWKYLTPIYATGTVVGPGTYDGPSNKTTVTGAGTVWDPAEIEAGDYLHFGSSSQREVSSTWVKITDVDGATQIRVEGDVSGYGSGVYTIRKVASFLGASATWDDETFWGGLPHDEDRWYVVNGQGFAYWDGVAAEVVGFDPGFTATFLQIYKNMLCAASLTEGGKTKPTSLRNSAIGEPQNFTTKEASETLVTDRSDEITALEVLGDFLIPYCRNEVPTYQFTNQLSIAGAPLVFEIRRALPDVGCIGRGLVVNRGDFHEFVSGDTAYQFDGVTKRELASQVFREVLRSTLPENIDQGGAYHDKVANEIYWVIPASTDIGVGGYATTIYTEHYLEPRKSSAPMPIMSKDIQVASVGAFVQANTLRFDDFPGPGAPDRFIDQLGRFNSTVEQTGAPRVIAGGPAGELYLLNASGSANGQPITSRWRTGRRPTLDGVHKGMIRRITPLAEEWTFASTYKLIVRVFGADQADGNSSLIAEEEYDLRQEDGMNRFVSPRSVSRFHELEFETVGTAAVATIEGFLLEVVPAGFR